MAACFFTLTFPGWQLWDKFVCSARFSCCWASTYKCRGTSSGCWQVPVCCGITTFKNHNLTIFWKLKRVMTQLITNLWPLAVWRTGLLWSCCSTLVCAASNGIVAFQRVHTWTFFESCIPDGVNETQEHMMNLLLCLYLMSEIMISWVSRLEVQMLFVFLGSVGAVEIMYSLCRSLLLQLLLQFQSCTDQFGVQYNTHNLLSHRRPICSKGFGDGRHYV